MSTSQLRFYSLGTVAENLVIGSAEIEVTPNEILNFVDGELKSNPLSDTVSGVDAKGTASQTSVTTDNTLKATWLPFGSNRRTAPNVRRGERVMIWRFSNLDTFYWTELGLDPAYRKLETVVYAFNATQNEADTAVDAKNHYYVEVSTHKGTITLQTSKANGEKCTHNLQFNPMAGTFVLTDDIGQAVFIDSINHIVHLTNADQSQVTLSKQDITVQCSDTLNLTSNKTVNLSTQNLNISAKTTKITSDTIQVSATSVNVSATNVDLSASGEFSVASPSATICGVKVVGGVVTCTQINASGAITCNQLTSTLNVIAPNTP